MGTAARVTSSAHRATHAPDADQLGTRRRNGDAAGFSCIAVATDIVRGLFAEAYSDSVDELDAQLAPGEFCSNVQDLASLRRSGCSLPSDREDSD